MTKTMRRMRAAMRAARTRWRAAEIARERRELVWTGGGFTLQVVTAERWSTWEPDMWAVPGAGPARLGEDLHLTTTDAIAALRMRLLGLPSPA